MSLWHLHTAEGAGSGIPPDEQNLISFVDDDQAS